jgi:hypothetical protein
MSRKWNLDTGEIAVIVLFSGSCGFALAEALASSTGEADSAPTGRAMMALGMCIALLAGILIHYRRKSRSRIIANAE